MLGVEMVHPLQTKWCVVYAVRSYVINHKAVCGGINYITQLNDIILLSTYRCFQAFRLCHFYSLLQYVMINFRAMVSANSSSSHATLDSL